MMDRSAGILLHISSLPSRYGIGDLGPESFAFADFLESAGQTWWQILPISPTEQVSGNSPYSGLSAFAGNILLISPEYLVKDGLLEKEDLPENVKNTDKVDFEKATEVKIDLLEKSFRNFRNNAGKELKDAFEKFCKEEDDWLESYSLYAALKTKYKKSSWQDWPEGIKFRQEAAIRKVKEELKEGIQKEQFFQFLFYRQWFSLKSYCNSKGIRIFGDIPFYVGLDSSDVWAGPGLFKLNESLEPVAVSGVPPDYFSETGQLWGTPVFRWAEKKKEVHHWWKRRLKQCLRIYDLLRLDHFRAFSDYWEVPAGEETAINGKWQKGPGASFFKELKEELPDLPLVAEDLGDIDQAVHDLMDQFQLPGMRILQFAFGDKPGENLYAPHMHIKNSLVYTGTHDNNTVRGWVESASAKERRNLSQYTGRRITPARAPEVLIRMALGSVAHIAVAPMQDYLGLGEEAIMNRPSVAKGNWLWRMQEGQASPELGRKIKNWTVLYGRQPKAEKKKSRLKE